MHTTAPDALTSLSSAGGARRRSLVCRVASAVTALTAATAATLILTAAPATADDCPNGALRAQNNSAQLPDCRAYELVSPLFKEGFSPFPTGFTDDGRLSYITNGNYDNNGNGTAAIPGGNAYIATRSGSGWSTTSLAPGSTYVTTNAFTSEPGATAAAWPVAFSSDMRSTLWSMRRADQPLETQDFYRRDSDGVFTRLGSAPDQPTGTDAAPTVSASGELSHVVFSVTSGETYEFVGTGGDQRRAVSVDNAGQSLMLGPECGSTRANGVSADGRVIFLTCRTPVSDLADAVYVRVGGTTTIAVSGSQCTRAPSDPGGACNAHSAALFQGASADGTRMYFTTSQQLVNGDTDDTNDVYECDLPTGPVTPVGSVNQCPDLREVSGAADGAEVQQVTRISDDGSRVVFVATGVLASNPGVNGATAVAGEQNLYVWTRDNAHPDGETRFVAAGAEAEYAQTTGDGRYLAFTTLVSLIDTGPQADSDTARDVYRYDAETGALSRLSIDADGAGGNEPGADANIISARHGAMSDDGGSVVFTTADTLAPNDTNGTIDTYLWQGGRVSLISSGKPSADQAFVIGINQTFGVNLAIQAFISPSGRDVFFNTTAQLISSDVDTVMDFYDARVEGGFDQSTPPTCAGDGCQRPPSAPPPATEPGSTWSTGENDPPQITPAFSVGKLAASQLKRVASTGKFSLVVTTNAPGRLSAKATTTIAKRLRTVGSAKRTVAKAGTVSLPLTLSQKARAELKRKRKLTIKVLVAQDNVSIARTVSLKVTQPRPKPKKSSKRRAADMRMSAGGRS